MCVTTWNGLYFFVLINPKWHMLTYSVLFGKKFYRCLIWEINYATLAEFPPRFMPCWRMAKTKFEKMDFNFHIYTFRCFAIFLLLRNFSVLQILVLIDQSFIGGYVLSVISFLGFRCKGGRGIKCVNLSLAICYDKWHRSSKWQILAVANN